MSGEDGGRSLAAIMITDIVGYTEKTHRNESLAMSLLEEHRKVLRQAFSKHGGREVKTMGDAFLVKFQSALSAVRCAYEVQRQLREFNSGRDDERKVVVRIGLHMGDVIEEGHDIYGDAVNVVSRIEPLAEPGGICLTRQVYEDVRNKFELRLASMGVKALKNVEEPVEVFRVVLPWEKETAERGASNKVAILPFANMSPDPNDEYFADGMTEELISTVANVSGLAVISRTSVMRYKKHLSDKSTTEIGRELGVTRLVEGSVRKSGNRLRITVQLIDATKDEHVWAESYDREMQDVFAVQAEIARRVAESMRVAMLAGTPGAVKRKAPTDNMEAYELYLRAMHSWERVSERSSLAAIDLMHEAIKMDSNFALAYATLGNYYVHSAGTYIPMKEGFEKAKPLIARALELDPALSVAHLARGNLALQYEFDWDTAEKEIETAIRLNPSDPYSHKWLATLRLLAGDIDGALAEAKRACELDPLSFDMQLTLMSTTAGKRDFKAALGLAQKLIETYPDSWQVRLNLAYFYFELGMANEAEGELEKTHDIGSVIVKAALAFCYVLIGKQEKGRALAEEALAMDRRGLDAGIFLAVAYWGLGEREKALDMLERQFEDVPVSFLFWHASSIFDPMRNEPRFQALEAKLNKPKWGPKQRPNGD